jgi:hypothetical protein
MSNFEHVNFAINEKYLKQYDNPNYYVSFMIFQTYKNAILESVHSLGLLFDCVFTHLEFENLKKSIK